MVEILEPETGAANGAAPTTNARAHTPTTTTPDPSPAGGGAVVSEELRAWMLAYIERTDGMGRDTLGRQLGYSGGTMVTKYINRFATQEGKVKVEGDVARFEKRVRDLQRLVAAEAIHQHSDAAPFFPTSVSESVRLHLLDFRASHMMGIIWSEAGLGKTRALQHFADTEENVFLITATAMHRGCTGIMQGLWAQISHVNHKGNMSRLPKILKRLSDAKAMVVIDNAQRLDNAGRNCVCDLHDATGAAIALVGDETVMENFSGVRTQFSRANQVRPVELLRVADVAAKIVSQYIPEHTAALAGAAAEVAGSGGLRVLVKTLQSTVARLALAGYRGNPEKAFRDARACSLEVALATRGRGKRRAGK